MTKKALAVISFGTSFIETRKKTITAIEQDLHRAFPEYDLYTSFTSGMIRRKLEKRDAEQLFSPEALFDYLAQNGYTELLIQPTHIIPGDEYEKVLTAAEKAGAKFETIRIGTPLLQTEQDIKKTADILSETYRNGDKQSVLFMGHGTTHEADRIYTELAERLTDSGSYFLATVEGSITLDDVLQKIPAGNRVTLVPLMIVAGDHACNDMAGADEDSWESRLTALGYETNAVLKGLGELAQIRMLFTEHLKAAAGISSPTVQTAIEL